MTPAQQKPSDSHSSGFVRFLVGLGVGLASGLSAIFLRRLYRSRRKSLPESEPVETSRQLLPTTVDVSENFGAQDTVTETATDISVHYPRLVNGHAMNSDSLVAVEETSIDSAQENEREQLRTGAEESATPGRSLHVEESPFEELPQNEPIEISSRVDIQRPEACEPIESSDQLLTVTSDVTQSVAHQNTVTESVVEISVDSSPFATAPAIAASMDAVEEPSLDLGQENPLEQPPIDADKSAPAVQSVHVEDVVLNETTETLPSVDADSYMPSSPHLVASVPMEIEEDQNGAASDISDDVESNPLTDRRAGNESAARRPRPAESFTEYASSVGGSLPVEYLRWNRWIIEHMFSATQTNQIYLSITPTILAGIAVEQSGVVLSPEDAEAQFVAALRAAYRVVIVEDGRLRLLRTFDNDGLPLAPAFLALSVLAAYRMQSDVEVSGRAYYMRLAELLACGMTAGHPEGFDPVVFESLWFFTEKWIAERTGNRLVLPGGDVGVRRFIALPLTHVPLRRLDIEKLPTFFDWAGYSAGAGVPLTKLSLDLHRWARSYAALSAAGNAALTDERRHAVIAQLALELEAWDGSVTEPNGRRSASVELMLDIVRFRPDLFYLPRRPEGFPSHFDDGIHVLDAGEDGWYDPLQLSADDGQELSDGFEWTCTDRVSMRRPPASVVPLGPSPDYTGFLSRSNLLRGTPCAVLCEERIVQVAADYLRATTGRPCTPMIHPSLPAGWRLFTDIKPSHRVDVPEGLDMLGLASKADIVCVGGLRLGRRREWLAGAPPKIIVSGLDTNDVAKVDGQVVSIGEDGVLQTNGYLFVPGTHTVEAGPVRRTIDIVEPLVGSAHKSNGFDSRVHYATLPPGRWYLVGAIPGQITARQEAGRSGRICKAEFDPVWAISVDAGPGATLVSINPLPVAAVEGKWISTRGLQWVSIVYSAGMRRPKIGSLLPNSDQMAINAIWKGYVRAARQIKREWRRK